MYGVTATECRYNLFSLMVGLLFVIVTMMKYHTVSYAAPVNLSYMWNMGVNTFYVIFIQIVVGLLICFQYSSEIVNSYVSVMYMARECYYGYMLHYIHSYQASFVFVAVYLHYGRGIYEGLYYTNVWISGIVMYLCLMAIAFLGYVLVWGMISYWGATVITNLLAFVPYFLEWVMGSVVISTPTLKRFFLFHFVLPFLVLGLAMVHLYYLHNTGSHNPLGLYGVSVVSFYPLFVFKDAFGLAVLMCLYAALCSWNVVTLSHPDNMVLADTLVTPLHIVPEWYFLLQYGVLKSLPSKYAGLLALAASIFIALVMLECYLGSNQLVYYGSYSTYVLLISVFYIWLGGQLPADAYVSYSRSLLVLYLLGMYLLVALLVIVTY